MRALINGFHLYSSVLRVSYLLLSRLSFVCRRVFLNFEICMYVMYEFFIRFFGSLEAPGLPGVVSNACAFSAPCIRWWWCIFLRFSLLRRAGVVPHPLDITIEMVFVHFSRAGESLHIPCHLQIPFSFALAYDFPTRCRLPLC